MDRLEIEVRFAHDISGQSGITVGDLVSIHAPDAREISEADL